MFLCLVVMHIGNLSKVNRVHGLWSRLTWLFTVKWNCNNLWESWFSKYNLLFMLVCFTLLKPFTFKNYLKVESSLFYGPISNCIIFLPLVVTIAIPCSSLGLTLVIVIILRSDSFTLRFKHGLTFQSEVMLLKEVELIVQLIYRF